jgi:hypothetical protein
MRRSPRAGLYNLIAILFLLASIGVIVFVVARLVG